MNIVRGVVSLALVSLNTVLACIPLFGMALVRAPCTGAARRTLNRHMDRIIDLWVGNNTLIFRALDLTRIHVQWQGSERLARDRWYLVVSNHQTWADIMVLQNSLLNRIPPLKFFTKRQLLWIPLVGVAMWLLGFPYVRRATREAIERDPTLLERDRRSTLDACEKFRDHPTSVLNFLEGSRFTRAKHAAADSRFQHLLNPKLGGASYVVDALKDRLAGLVDVTISYPAGVPTFWDLLKGRCREVRVLVQCHELPGEVRSATDSEAVRAALKPWIEGLWQEKDKRLTLTRLAN